MYNVQVLTLRYLILQICYADYHIHFVINELNDFTHHSVYRHSLSPCDSFSAVPPQDCSEKTVFNSADDPL